MSTGAVPTKEDLEKLSALLDRSPVTDHREGDYAELLDESQLDGVVVIRRKNGTPISYMPRALWEELLEWNKEEEAKKG